MLAEYVVLTVSNNDTFNYFFTLVISWGVILVPINWCLRIVSRS